MLRGDVRLLMRDDDGGCCLLILVAAGQVAGDQPKLKVAERVARAKLLVPVPNKKKEKENKHQVPGRPS